MKPWNHQDFRRDLDRLCRHARANARRGTAMFTDPEPPQGRTIRSTRGRPVFSIEGEALPLMRSLQRRIAGSSRSTYGMSTNEAQVVLMECCSDAVVTTMKAAVASLVATLESDPGPMTVAETVNGAFPPGQFTVARTTYMSRIPSWIATKDRLGALAVVERFQPPIMVTNVVCRGFTTGRVLAHRNFADSGAILDLAAPPANIGGEAYWVDAGPRTGGIGFMRSGWILNQGLLSRGRLVPPYRRLALAAAKDATDQSDWERRLLAATRWWSRAYRSQWPADRLSSTIVALECLFVPDGQKKQQGSTIANSLTERFLLNEFDRRKQRRWLQALYDGRSDALHAGREYVNDLDVDRLLELTRHIVQTFAAHLIPGHRPTGGGPCRTFEQAMRCSAPLTVTR